MSNQILPDNYVEQQYGKSYNHEKHYDSDFIYTLLDTTISVRWRPMVNENGVDDLIKWTTAPYTDTPTFILFGRFLSRLLSVCYLLDIVDN